jgi:hypothetical protein
VAARAADFPGSTIVVGVSVPFAQGNLVVSKTAAGRGYCMRNADGSRYTGVRAVDGQVLTDLSSGDGGTAILNLLQSWETAGII